MRDDEPGARATFDEVADELQSLRARAGHLSYAQIVSRIFEARLLADPAARPPSRSTVYDAFKFGRQRVDVVLVLEIARALGADAAGCADLEDRCCRIRDSGERVVPARTRPAGPPAADPDLIAPAGTVRPHAGVYLLVMLAAIGLNTAGHGVVAWLGLPLYLDMIGTCAAAIALGPWWGAAVGLASNLVGSLINTEAAIPFAAVNIVGALVWGYGVRSWGWGRTLQRFFTLNLVAALACTLTAVPILVLVFQGETGHAGDSLMHTLSRMGETLVLAVFSANLVSSVADKLIAGFAALVLVGSLGRWLPLPAGGLWSQSRTGLGVQPVAVTPARLGADRSGT